MSREEAKQIIIDCGVAFKYSGIKSDEVTFKFEDFVTILGYIENITEETTEFNNSEIGMFSIYSKAN